MLRPGASHTVAGHVGTKRRGACFDHGHRPRPDAVGERLEFIAAVIRYESAQGKQFGIAFDRRGGGCPVFPELSKNMIDRDELLARALAIVFGVEKVAGFDQLGREREQGGGPAPGRGGQGARELGVKLGRDRGGTGGKIDLRRGFVLGYCQIVAVTTTIPMTPR